VTSCERFRPELGGYVLDGLEADERLALLAHLDECGGCRDEVEELQELPGLLALVETAPRRAPEDLRQRVLGRSRARRIPALLAAAIAVVAAIAGAASVTWLDRPPAADTVLTLRGDAPVGMVGEASLRQVDAGVRVDLELAGVRTADQGYYHAWLHRGDLRVSAGTFVGPADGELEVQLLCGGRLDDYDRLTVTWHPFDGPDEVVAIDAAFTSTSSGPPRGSPATSGDPADDPWTR
jgi:hypothetical protein